MSIGEARLIRRIVCSGFPSAQLLYQYRILTLSLALPLHSAPHSAPRTAAPLCSSLCPSHCRSTLPLTLPLPSALPSAPPAVSAARGRRHQGRSADCRRGGRPVRHRVAGRHRAAEQPGQPGGVGRSGGGAAGALAVAGGSGRSAAGALVVAGGSCGSAAGALALYLPTRMSGVQWQQCCRCAVASQPFLETPHPSKRHS